MYSFLEEYSFIATLKCQAPHWEAWLDNGEVQLESVDGERVARRLPTTALTLSNWHNGRPESRHRFWFRLMVEEGDRNPCYEIRSAEPGAIPGFQDYGGTVGVNAEGVLGFYPANADVPQVFYCVDANGSNMGGNVSEVRKYSGIRIRPVRDTSSILTVGNRRDAHDFWCGDVRIGGAGNADRPELIVDIKVLRMAVASLR